MMDKRKMKKISIPYGAPSVKGNGLYAFAVSAWLTEARRDSRSDASG